MLITNLCHAYQVVYNHTPHMFYGISDIYRSDNAPFALGMAVGIFTYFKRLTIAPNPYINKIASTTLAVYLIHANRVVFPHAFDLFKIAYFNQAPILILPYIVICSLVIFSICSILELLRVKYVETPLFQWLYETKK